MNKVYVLYHANCSDGFCAAWLFWRKFGGAAIYIPVSYGEPLPEITDGSKVFIVDFSYKRDIMIELATRCDLLVLDHHKTAEEELRGLEFCEFDLSRSGARMAWDYLYGPEDVKAFPHVYDIVLYVEDRDLWKWDLPQSKEFNTALRSYPQNFLVWELLGKTDWRELASEGIVIERYREQLISEHIRRAVEVQLAGHKVLCVNCSCGEIISEVAGQLAIGRPFGATISFNLDSKVYSLRSREGGVDVSEIAKQFGGGGHKHAAGFKIE